LADYLFPVECLSCSRPGLWLCQICREKAINKESQVCPVCKINNSLGTVHPSCHSYLDGVLVMGHYQGLLKRAIRAFKYQFAYEIGDELAEMLSNFFMSQEGIVKFDLVVPIPLSRRRYLWRGFNQSQILAQKIAEVSESSLSEDCLVKTRHSSAQAQLSWRERTEFRADNFSCSTDLDGKIILLVDDVMTTGQTLEVAAQILKSKGAQKIWALVLARGH
jgi:ComF family protein